MKRKNWKILTAAAVMSLGILTINAYAAEGWSMANNTWIYLDNNGNRVTGEWRKGADNLWRYLNNSGEMAINCWAGSLQLTEVVFPMILHKTIF